MKGSKVFEEGALVKVVNDGHRFYGEFAFVLSAKSDELYSIKLIGGQNLFLFAEEIDSCI